MTCLEVYVYEGWKNAPDCGRKEKFLRKVVHFQFSPRPGDVVFVPELADAIGNMNLKGIKKGCLLIKQLRFEGDSDLYIKIVVEKTEEKWEDIWMALSSNGFLTEQEWEDAGHSD